jgi:steroid 5-alpha reductase family enzyme
MWLKSVIQAAAAVVIGLLVGLAGGYGGESVGGIRLFFGFAALAFIIQWLVYIPSYLAQTEHYFDLTGSLTYQTLAVLGLLLTSERDARTVILGLMIIVWAARLGLFLFRRVRAAGKDGRFDKLKTDWAQFLMTWTLQGLWVTFTAAAALAAMTSGAKTGLGVIGVIGIIVWVAGFAIEVIADAQKSTWRAMPGNENKFITVGLWAWSRHPNYFGEVLLWTGVAILAAPALQGWQYITLLSPVFVYLLLNKASGVPMLEARADKKWGGQPAYEDYKARTPVFFPRPPRRAGA